MREEEDTRVQGRKYIEVLTMYKYIYILIHSETDGQMDRQAELGAAHVCA